MSIFDTYLDKVYRKLRTDLYIQDLQEKADMLERILENAGIQDDGDYQTDDEQFDIR